MSLADRELPPGLVQHRQTPEFSKETFPAALGRDHSTKAGIWGVLNVLSGFVTYHDRELDETREVRTGETQVILPESVHSARPSEDARFFVRFFRAADAPGDDSPVVHHLPEGGHEGGPEAGGAG